MADEDHRRHALVPLFRALTGGDKVASPEELRGGAHQGLELGRVRT
jgi:hypothetical protein